MSTPAFAEVRALGCLVVIGAVHPSALRSAVETVRREVDLCDAACSRFRDDSELSRLNVAGRLDDPSDWLCDALDTALTAAAQTDGLVDPTIGQSLVDLGYDRSFDLITPDAPLVVTARHVPAWRQVRVERAGRRVSIPVGTRVDLGATAKALCADRAAAAAALAAGTGVLVSLGGDVAVAGDAPAGGWTVRVTDRSDTPPDADVPGQTVAVSTGGLATSGTAARRWSRAGAPVHHLLDPRTGRPAADTWRTATVAAPTCVAANTAATASIVLGAEAPAWLRRHGHHARLVAPDGAVVLVGDWPSEPEDHGSTLVKVSA